MQYRLKKKATRGDIARISFLIFCAYAILWVGNIILLADLEMFVFTSVLLLEGMAMSGFCTIQGSIFDFTDAPKEPRGWISSIFLEKRCQGPSVLSQEFE